MRAAVRRLRRVLGRRGIAPLLLGTGKILHGLGSILTSEPNPPGSEALTRWADSRCWASVWVACGAITFGCAWLRIGRDRWGFIAALGPPFHWGSAYLWGAGVVTGSLSGGWRRSAGTRPATRG
ncbi:hypothetical protein GCM10010259_06730 [Streptomyces daghestanicus]|uniref:Integral membrane protein n=1 Tax=Streptomyces daghestanicus TaxID=66885 RepID=A0ABQ3PX94_9ACTN|nr:hypothetical protein GCM10010259_06730 [Streptomyces daghestanicus]GHI29641.1 hypothetical protein Sdagh_13710 [Streptomyces daghestanicus]